MDAALAAYQKEKEKFRESCPKGHCEQIDDTVKQLEAKRMNLIVNIRKMIYQLQHLEAEKQQLEAYKQQLEAQRTQNEDVLSKTLIQQKDAREKVSNLKEHKLKYQRVCKEVEQFNVALQSGQREQNDFK